MEAKLIAGEHCRFGGDAKVMSGVGLTLHRVNTP